MGRNSFLIYTSYLEHFAILSDEDSGKLIKALLYYSNTGEEPDLQGMAKMAFSFIRSQIDRDNDKYQHKCEKNRENIRIRWDTKNTNEYDRIRTNTKHTDDDKDNDDDKEEDINKPPIIPLKSGTVEKKAAERKTDPRFEKFWKAYPRRVAKQSAKKAWDKLKPDDSLIETMVNAIRAQTKEKASLQANGKFCPEWPHPATWLNGHRWDDESQEIQPMERPSRSSNIKSAEEVMREMGFE